MSDVVIVGAGVIGTATAWALTERGVTDITILDRDSVGSGGTGKSAGIIRCHYGVSSVAALALESLKLFENAQELLGTDIGFEQVGYLVGVGPENVDPFRASLANQRSLGVETLEISASEVAAVWPSAYLDDFATFCLEPRGGYGDGYATAQALAAALRARGVTIRQGAKVAELVVEGDVATGVKLTDGEVIPAGTVVVAAGAWSVPLLDAVGITLPVQPIFVQEVLIDPQVDLGAPPVFSDLVAKQYVHLRGGEMLFGNSAGDAMIPIPDPDVYPNHASNEAVEAVAEKAIHRFPGIEEPRISTTATGVIDATPDNNPIVSATGVAGLYVAAGMSGHGFKISPGLGRLMAEIVLDGESSIPNVPASDFRLSRFDEGDLLLSPFAYVGTTGIR
jgi:glycine/D-amino acid oxidase-like deaminating enzyme